MPPPMPNPQKRMTANPARPVARYRPGKAVQEASSEEDDDEEEEDYKTSETQPPARSKPQSQTRKPNAPITKQVEEDDDEEGFVTDEEDGQEDGSRQGSNTLSQQAAPGTQSTVVETSRPEPLNQMQDKDESSSEGDEEDESSQEEEESSSEDEVPQRKFQRPTFIKKNQRNNSTSTNQPSAQDDMPITSDTPPAQVATSSSLDTDEQLRRKAQTELMIKDRIERDMLARAQGKKSWDDDDEVSPEQMVDDTDGLDPESEHQAWKLRELKRLKRDREAIEVREKEIEELERRRNLTQEERDREDADYIAKQKEDRDEGRGKANFMARYHHKGAFFQDDETAELLKKRDIMGARFVDEVSDKSTLPEYMRVRDMTKLGKKGRTRYTDLKGQDTGRFGEEVKRWRGAGGDERAMNATGANAIGNVDERFMTDRERERRGLESEDRRRESELQRRPRESARRYDDRESDRDDRDHQRDRRRSRSRSPRQKRRYDDDYDDRDRRESYRPQRRRSYSRSSSRSKSPPPRRKRSVSPYDARDKRRRLEA